MAGCNTSCCTAGGWAEPVKDGVGRNNPVLRQALGICSALAVTGFVSTTLVMCAALLFVSSLSCLIVSLIRKAIPHRVRLIVQMLVISTLVIVVHLYLRAFHYEMSQALGPYVGLIITNSLILGRCEGYAMRNGPVASFLDGFGNAAGYALVLLAISLIREPLGNGTLLGHAIMPAAFRPAMLLKAAPGAFLTMGIVVWIVRAIRPDTEASADPETAG
jgi:Na+-transporting NADH:ubiquinone oxidoreductase subunit D